MTQLIIPIEEHCICGGSAKGGISANGVEAFRRAFWQAHHGEGHEKTDFHHVTIQGEK